MGNKIFILQMAVCALVTAAFTNIYITQPILPVLQAEFNISTVQVSLTVSFVILGIVISNLFFGYLSDRVSIQPILMVGGIVVAGMGIICACTHDFNTLIYARLLQGLDPSPPALAVCLCICGCSYCFDHGSGPYGAAWGRQPAKAEKSGNPGLFCPAGAQGPCFALLLRGRRTAHVFSHL